MITVYKVLFLLLSYLLGSIPFGLLIGKLKKIDLREKGSNNIGAANATRVLGKKLGILTFALDMIKGALFVGLFRYKIIPETYMVLSPAIYGLLATIGHTFSIFVGFKGGKGVATGAGAIFAYLPITIFIGISSFLIVVLITKIASLGSLTAGTLSTITAIIFTLIGYDFITGLDIDIYFMISSILILILIYVRHIPNIKRLINKNENKIIQK